MGDTRQDVASRGASAMEAARIADFPALVGFDGFIDSIIHMVDVRRNMSPSGYERLRTITTFAARCASAAGKSTNIEQVLVEDRFGGNGPLMASALGRLGVPVTYAGAVGEGQTGKLHRVFGPFAERCREVIPTSPPSFTDCLEFDDGKLMFNNTAAVQAVTWDVLVKVAGLEKLTRLIDESSLIGIVNWSLMGGVPGIWRGLREEILPKVSTSRARSVFIDLSDPAKRTDADIEIGLADLLALNRAIPVTLGLNLSEAERVSAVAGANAFGQGRSGADIRRAAAAIRARLGLACVVIHPREGAAASIGEQETDSAWFDGPLTQKPLISTGAGDHFNGGFAIARTLGLPLAESLAVGTAVSGAYVRDGESPTLPRLAEFLRALPQPIY